MSEKFLSLSNGLLNGNFGIVLISEWISLGGGSVGMEASTISLVVVTCVLLDL